MLSSVLKIDVASEMSVKIIHAFVYMRKYISYKNNILLNLEERILITTSCKASVKANTKLSIWQMEDIIKKWRTTQMPYTCPHGRPIAKTIPHKELAGFFQRAK